VEFLLSNHLLVKEFLFIFSLLFMHTQLAKRSIIGIHLRSYVACFCYILVAVMDTFQPRFHSSPPTIDRCLGITLLIETPTDYLAFQFRNPPLPIPASRPPFERIVALLHAIGHDVRLGIVFPELNPIPLLVRVDSS